MRFLAALLAGSVLAAFCTPGVRAQGNPSASEIELSLRPANLMSGTTRGFRGAGSGAGGYVAPEPSPIRPSGIPAAAHSYVAPPRRTAPPSGGGAVSLTVQFATNSAQLTPAAVKTLTDLGEALSRPSLAQSRFRIEGHTDTAGDASANKLLSERRAQAVVEFLDKNFGNMQPRLVAVGLGEDGLLVQTPPNTPEARNRRVQVINLGS